MLEQYIKEIQSLNLKNTKEHSYRTPLETLINKFKFPNLDKQIIQEASDKELQLEGTPDFFIYKDYQTLFKTLVGFIECKKISFELEELIASEQIKKYSKTSENIIITNYREFILLQKGKRVAEVKILEKDLQETANQNKETDFENLLQSFYSYEYAYINNKQSLTKTLANSSFYYSVSLREFISSNQTQNHFYIKFNTLFKEVQTSLQIAYSLEDFCDVYSQSLVYGLLIARLEMEDKFLEETKTNYISFIPNDYKLLTEFLESGYSERAIPNSIKKALVQIGKNLNFVNIPAIKEEFAKKNEGVNAIAVYLYEDFLKEYDVLRATEKRKENGVYYTPKEVASFIVRAVDDVLKNSFQKKKGIAENGVKVLDFACGTGTFLASVLDFLLEKDIDALEKENIKKKILADLHGFELLFTPYIVAHTILTQRLKQAGIKLNDNQRLGIYLTNTLDITEHSISGHLPYLKDEHEKASKIKTETEILAIIGNPPYRSGKSDSLAKQIDSFISEDYKKGLNERNPRLDDLYIKFIKFAEWKVNLHKAGVVGIITNNSFLDGLTHRKMREHLSKTFDEIYILNLHGNTRKGETDKNVFDIMVGVNISIFIKRKADLHPSSTLAGEERGEGLKIKYFSTIQNNIISRKEKLQFLEENTLESIKWQELTPNEPNFWFLQKDETGIESYQEFIGLIDIFENYNSGMKTGRDNFCIHYSKESLEELRKNIHNLGKNQISEHYKVKDSRDWKIEKAQQDLIKNYNYNIICYRPFDFRHTSLSKSSNLFLDYSRYEIMKHFDNKDNLGLCLSRSFSNENYSNIFITKNIIDIHYNSDQSYHAPLYIYSNNDGGLIEEEEEKKPNFKKAFLEFLQETYKESISPEEVLHYIYAVLHSPVYRSKYIEFLKTDFPKIPFAKSLETFKKYAELGRQLTELHTLSNLPKEKEIKVNKVLEEFVIKNITHSLNALHLETTSKEIITFERITKDIWEFEIGSYKPIEKWLKYRKADEVVLGTADLQHIKNMAISIKNTIEVMKKLEALGEEFLN